jgi:aminoglycoside 6'-N-acetyltransferase I
MSTVRIRAAEPADRAEWARMRVALWPDADPQELVDELGAFLADPDQVAFVAERPRGRLCGLVEASVRAFAEGVDERPCAFVEGWWVDADVRRTGLGRALIEAVESWARDRGFTELGSNVELHNTRSQQAHLALGFEERERVVYYRKRL